MKTIKTQVATARAANAEAYQISALRALCCSADFKSAVSPTCSRRSVESVPRTGVSQRLAECNSAIQQSTTLRYNWALNTYTVAATDSSDWATRPAVKVRAAKAKVATARAARSMTPEDLTWEPEPSVRTNRPVSLGHISQFPDFDQRSACFRQVIGLNGPATAQPAFFPSWPGPAGPRERRSSFGFVIRVLSDSFRVSSTIAQCEW